MSRWRPDRFRGTASHVVAVDAEGFAWTKDGEMRTGRHEELATSMASIPPGSMVDLIACSDVAVHWLQQVPRSLASLAELRLAAAARCSQLFGGKASDWIVTGDWRVDREFACSALPRAFVARIEETLKPLALRVRWHTAAECAMRSETGPTASDGWTGMRAASTVALWHTCGGRIDSVAVLRTGPGRSEDDVLAGARRHVVAEHARRGIEGDDGIRWLVTEPGASESETTFRFCAPRVEIAKHLPLAATAALAAAAFAIVAIGVQIREDAATLDATQGELSRLQAAAAPMPSRQPSGAAQQRRALEQVTRQLNIPWSQLLDSLEGSLPDDVALVSIEPDGGAGKVRLQSEAKKLDSLIAYAARLREMPMFSAVALLKHETNDQDANRPLRLMLEVELASPAVARSSTR